MSINTSHANNGVLIHAGEVILLFSDNVTMEFSGQDGSQFKGSKQGRIYLTTHRMIFNNKKPNDSLASFSFPFVVMSDVDIEQPVFGANFLKGKVRAQQNGGWTGEAKFKLLFKSGGAIDYGQAMLKAAGLAQRNQGNTPPPPYTPPSSGWYAAPPPAYTSQQNFGWIPPNSQTAFPNMPPTNGVFMSDDPPPYSGVVPNYASGGMYPQLPQAQGVPGMQPNNGFAPSAPGGNFQPGPQPGYPQPPQNGFGFQPNGFAGASGLTQPQNGYGYQPNQGAMGFNVQPSPAVPNSKEAEAQHAYYDPSRPQTAFVPPPSYYEMPPSYQNIAKKDN